MTSHSVPGGASAPSSLTVALATITLPGLAALAVVAFIVVERAAVDPTVSAGVEGASPIPFWYVPLAVFAAIHGLALAWIIARGNGAARFAGLGLAVVAAAFLLSGGPIIVGETVFGILLVLVYLLVIVVFLWPAMLAIALAMAGGFFGLAVHLPAAAAFRLRAQETEPEDRRPHILPLLLAGIAVASLCVAVFGDPTRSAAAGRGRYSFPTQGVEQAWMATAPAIAASIVLIGLAGLAAFRLLARPVATLAFIGLLPIGLVAGFGGKALSVLRGPATAAGPWSLAPVERLARFARDGRPRIGDAIVVSGRVLAIDRSLLRYQLADNPRRSISTVAFGAPPDLAALGVRDPVIINSWRVDPERAYLERNGGSCTPGPSPAVIECRHREGQPAAFEIDARRPERWYEKAACRVIIGSIDGAAVHARVVIDCADAGRWTERAEAIERRLAALLARPAGAAPAP